MTKLKFWGLRIVLAAVIVAIIVATIMTNINILSILSSLDDAKIRCVNFEELYQYRLEDNFYNDESNDYWSEFVADPLHVEKLAAFNKALHDNMMFDYYEFAFMGLYIYKDDFKGGASFGDKDEYTFDNYKNDRASIKSILIGDGYLKKHNLSIDIGRGFTSEDFYFTQSIPIILGSSYRNIYSLGDNITIIYYGEVYTGSVIGFLSKDSFIEHEGFTMQIDDYIITPMQCFKTIDSIPTDHGIHIYLDKNMGSINTDLNPKEMQQLVDTMSKDAGLSPPYTVYGGYPLNSIKQKYENYYTLLFPAGILLYILSACVIGLIIAAYIFRTLAKKAVLSILCYLATILICMAGALVILLVKWDICIYDIGVLGTVCYSIGIFISAVIYNFVFRPRVLGRLQIAELPHSEHNPNGGSN